VSFAGRWMVIIIPIMIIIITIIIHDYIRGTIWEKISGRGRGKGKGDWDEYDRSTLYIYANNDNEITMKSTKYA
jgi:hypothetical protein